MVISPKVHSLVIKPVSVSVESRMGKQSFLDPVLRIQSSVNTLVVNEAVLIQVAVRGRSSGCRGMQLGEKKTFVFIFFIYTKFYCHNCQLFNFF